MSSKRWADIQRIFEAASTLPADERLRYLDDACAGDASLRLEIESLLASRDAAGSFLEAPAVPGLSARDLDPATVSRPDADASDPVGPYRLQRKLGEGGMGEVWLAEQVAPIRRRVALKVIKAGLDSKEVIARFETERQALAVMDHPNIARVLDAGTMPSGRPFFVMEYVEGVPLTSYCDSRGLAAQDRLELFIQLCRGVQHAHQKAIIHRDLKPSNVLVTEHERAAVPKIIDFGVAKALSGPLTGRTLATEFGQLIGTPAYMSPEQADMSADGVDTRTDVYSLGVILYELLVGGTPLDPAELRGAGLDEIRRRIREEEPQRPSTRSRARDARALADRRRPAGGSPSAQQLRGDLDWIVMKALEKDPNRRYGSAAELAAEIERHLHHLPVLARPPGTRYRVGKFVRRHKAAVGATATLGVLLIAFAATTAFQARRIAEQRDRAREAEARATAINDFLVKEMLAAASPEEAEGRVLTVAEVLDVASRKIGESFPGQPTIEVPLRVTLGGIYLSLGRFDDAERQCVAAERIARRQIGPHDPRTLAAIRGLADVKSMRGQYDQAEPLYREALEGQRRALGERHPETLATMKGLGSTLARAGRHADAEEVGRRALQGFREALGNDDRRTVESLVDYATTLLVLRSPEAERYLRESCERCRAVLGPRDPLNAEAMNNLAIFLNRQGRLEEAERAYRDCVRLCVAVYGEDHPSTLSVRVNMARFISERVERPWESETLLREVLDAWRRRSGDERSITTAIYLGELLITLGRAEEGRRVLSGTLREAESLLGADHARSAMTLADLGWANRVQGRLRDAEDCYRRTLEIRRKVLGPNHEHTLRATAQLAWVIAEQGRREEGERLARAAVERGERMLPEGHVQQATLHEYLGRILLASGRAAEAETHLRRALEIGRANHITMALTAETECLLGRCLLHLGDLEGAEGFLTRAWPVIARNRGASYPPRESARRDVREVYRRLGTPARADTVLAAPTLEMLAATHRSEGTDLPPAH